MPLVPNDTDGALTRKRLETWVAKEEKVTVVAATDAATVQVAATLAAAGEVVYTMTPTATRTLTTPTGAELGAAFTDEAVGSSFRFTVVNLAAATHAITLTAGASGSRIDDIYMVATGTTTAGVIRLFVHDGTNARLLSETLVSAVTPSTTVQVWSNTLLSQAIVLKTGYSLRASTQIGETFNIIVTRAGDF